MGLALFPGNPPPLIPLGILPRPEPGMGPKWWGWDQSGGALSLIPLGPSPEVAASGVGEPERISPLLTSFLPSPPLQIEFNKDQLEGEEKPFPKPHCLVPSPWSESLLCSADLEASHSCPGFLPCSAQLQHTVPCPALA